LDICFQFPNGKAFGADRGAFKSLKQSGVSGAKVAAMHRDITIEGDQ